MAETAPPGFLARNNQVIGSALSIVALVVAALLGAGLMFGTDTRGVRAILTVLTIAGGTFTLLLLMINGLLRGVTPQDVWQAEEDDWRGEMGLPPMSDDDQERSAKGQRRAALVAVVAILVGLGLSVVPAVL